MRCKRLAPKAPSCCGTCPPRSGFSFFLFLSFFSVSLPNRFYDACSFTPPAVLTTPPPRAAHARATRASRPRRREPRPSARSVTRSHSLPARPGATRRQPAARRGWAEPPASAAPHAHRRSPLWASVHGGLRRGIGATPGGEPIDASRSSRGTRPPPGSPRRCLGTWRIRLACPAHNRGRRRCGRGS